MRLNVSIDIDIFLFMMVFVFIKYFMQFCVRYEKKNLKIGFCIFFSVVVEISFFYYIIRLVKCENRYVYFWELNGF